MDRRKFLAATAAGTVVAAGGSKLLGEKSVSRTKPRDGSQWCELFAQMGQESRVRRLLLCRDLQIRNVLAEKWGDRRIIVDCRDPTGLPQRWEAFDEAMLAAKQGRCQVTLWLEDFDKYPLPNGEPVWGRRLVDCYLKNSAFSSRVQVGSCLTLPQLTFYCRNFQVLVEGDVPRLRIVD